MRRTVAPRAAVIQGDGAPMVLPWYGRALDSTARAKAQGWEVWRKGPPLQGRVTKC